MGTGVLAFNISRKTLATDCTALAVFAEFGFGFDEEAPANAMHEWSDQEEENQDKAKRDMARAIFMQ